MKLLKCFSAAGAIAIYAAALAVGPSAAQGITVSHYTRVTVNEPVEIPGLVLQPGSYVFELRDSLASRNAVEVWDASRRHLIATVLAAPAWRNQVVGRTVLTLEERPNGVPEALHNWFYPGSNAGLTFIYPKAEVPGEVIAAAPALQVDDSGY